MSGSHRERDEGYSGVVAILAPGWRVILCKDGLQWIVQHKGAGKDWRSLRFCASRAGLLDSLRLASAVSPEARRIIAALPENACAHRRGVGGRPILPPERDGDHRKPALPARGVVPPAQAQSALRNPVAIDY